jgi:pimeloyl-ACP methyl ester carboxylesterase
MPQFISNDIEIAYEIYGEGKPIILVHGFASNGKVNWVDTGWVESLVQAGYQVVTIDNRGHGASQKLYDPQFYPARKMASDVINLIDHLGFDQVALMGYSMGTRISAFVALDAAEKVACAVFGGLGINLVRGLNNSDAIIAGLLAPSLADISNKTSRQFRIFAEHTKSDLRALAACMGSSRDRISEDDVATFQMPVLVAVGSADEVGGAPDALATLMPKGEAFVIEGRDHMRATGDKQFKSAALAFLARVY